MVVMTATLCLNRRAGKLEIPVLWPGLGGRMAPVTTVNQLSGRENELRSLEDFLERAAAAPSVLVLSGEAGNGKKGLLAGGRPQKGGRGKRGVPAPAGGGGS